MSTLIPKRDRQQTSLFHSLHSANPCLLIVDPVLVLLAIMSAIFTWSERNNLVLPVLKATGRFLHENRPGARTHDELRQILLKLDQLESNEMHEKLDSIQDFLVHLKKMLAFNIAKKTLLENHVRAATFMTDENGNYVSCSLEYQRMVGMSMEQLRGTEWKRAILPEDLPRWMDLWQSAFNDKRVFIGETLYVNQETNERLCVRVVADPVKCDGELIGYVGSVSRSRIKCDAG